MLAQLEVIQGPDKGKTFSITEGKPLPVGRGPAAEARLTDPFVSRLHCQFALEKGLVILSDMGGASGTHVNGKKVTQQLLRTGDVVQVGDSQLRLTITGEEEEGGTMTLAPRPVSKPTALKDLPGHTIAHFQVGELLARGRSGLVFHGTDIRTKEKVALKILAPEYTQTEEDMQRFIRGMKAALPLRHPNLVAVLAAGKSGPFCWTAMEYVEGDSLHQIIERAGIAGILDWRYGLRVATHIIRALDFACGHGIIHRNITPTNIIVRKSDGLAKLGDLVLAKALEGALSEQITRVGEIVGDLSYMSPERTTSETRVDGRSDIYSLGANVYALLTGQPPCIGKSQPDTVQKIRTVEPQAPCKVQLSIPPEFNAVVLKMLAKKPEERYQTPAVLLPELEKMARSHGVAV